MMKCILAMALLLGLPLQAGAQQTAAAAGERVLQQLLDGLSNADYDAVLTLFADDVLFWGTSTRIPGTGREAVAEYFASLRGQEPRRNIATAVQHDLRIVADDLHLVSGTWKVDMAATGTSVTFRTSIAVVQRDGQWKIMQFHNSAMP